MVEYSYISLWMIDTGINIVIHVSQGFVKIKPLELKNILTKT